MGQLSREGPLAWGSFLHPWLKSAIQACCRAQNWGESGGGGRRRTLPAFPYQRCPELETRWLGQWVQSIWDVALKVIE